MKMDKEDDDDQAVDSSYMLEPRERISNSQEELVAHIVQDIQRCSQQPKKARQASIFYEMVQTGQVSIVKQTLESLKASGLTKELQWAVTTKKGDNHRKAEKPPTLTKFKHLLVFTISAILCVVLSPIFYCLHTVMLKLYSITRKQIYENIDLPLMFAISSENLEILNIFLDHGCSLTDQDSDGNTVFHYLADLSLDNPDKSIRFFDFLCSGGTDKLKLREALMDLTNNATLSGFDATTRFGSICYLQHIIESGISIGKPNVNITQNRIFITGSNITFDIPLRNDEDDCVMKNDNSMNRNSESRVLSIDVSAYEENDVFGKQSNLFHLAITREVNTLPRADLFMLNCSVVLRSWMGRKRAKYAIYCILFHIFALLISFMFTTQIILNRENMIKYPLLGNYLTNAFNSGVKNFTAFDIALQKTYSDCEEKLSMKEIRDGIFITAEYTNKFYISDKILRWIMLSMIVIHAILNTMIREFYLFKNYNFKSFSLRHGFLPFMQRKIPGSYTENQITLLMYSLYFCSLWTFKMNENAMLELNLDAYKYYNIERDDYYSTNETEVTMNIFKKATQYGNITSILFIFCLLLRFILFIHALRLLPAIGFFVIITKKMAQDLAKFVTIFAIVLFAFSAMFHFVLKNPDCLALNVDGFGSVVESMMNLYKLVLAQRGAEFVTDDMKVQITYIIGTIIVSLMMLNLIIAIMTMTATDLYQAPCKEVTCLFELWDEILGTEAVVAFVSRPLCLLWFRIKQRFPKFRRICRRKRRNEYKWNRSFTVKVSKTTF